MTRLAGAGVFVAALVYAASTLHALTVECWTTTTTQFETTTVTRTCADGR